MSKIQHHSRTQELLNWALEQSTNSAEEKLLLFVFASFADIDGTATVRTIDLADRASLASWQIVRIIDVLVASGLISVQVSADAEVSYELLVK